MAIDPELLRQLEQAVLQRAGKAAGKEIRFTCPSHDDEHPSARWHTEKMVWFCDVCGTGGGAYQLAKLLGIETPSSATPGLTLQELADAKGFDVAFLRDQGIGEGVSGVERIKCVDIPYLDGNGEVAAVRKRLRLEGKPKMTWRKGDRVLPYGLWRLRDGQGEGSIVLV